MSVKNTRRAWWHISIIPAWELRQEDHKFEVSLGYTDCLKKPKPMTSLNKTKKP
jgi:hypothetical protein